MSFRCGSLYIVSFVAPREFLHCIGVMALRNSHLKPRALETKKIRAEGGHHANDYRCCSANTVEVTVMQSPFCGCGVFVFCRRSSCKWTINHGRPGWIGAR